MNLKFTINAEAVFVSSNWTHPQTEMVEITNSLKYLNLCPNSKHHNQINIPVTNGLPVECHVSRNNAKIF